MKQSKHLVIQAAQVGGLAILLVGNVTAAIAREVDFKPSPVPHSDFSSSSQVSGSIQVSKSDADTVENWLLGDVRKSIFGIGGFFFWRAEAVLAQPNAKMELAQIMARGDLLPHLRVYAQEMLMKAGQPPNPSLVEDYCYTLQNSHQINLLDALWGLPGEELREFGETLISYRQAALPCLSRLLNDENELSYGGNGEWNAIVTGMRYRKSDLAAYLITQILALPYNNDPDPAVRDQQLQDLRRRLGIPLKPDEKQLAPIITFSTNTAIDELITQPLQVKNRFLR